MEFNNLASILSCLKKWNSIKDNPDEAVEYLGLGNHFLLERDKPVASNLHAYPGICTADNELYMFLIDANDDKSSSESDLFNAITICKVIRNLGNSNEIPEAEAQKRINAWKKNYSSWATSQINLRLQTQGLFRAFNIPSSHIQKNVEYTIFFGLKEDSQAVVGYDADLITVDQSKSSIAFYDTVRPVPPFDVAPQSSFHLLSML